MGEVWAGYDQRLDRPIAVKLLRKDLFPGAGGQPNTRAELIRDRFVRESRSTARIDHPGVPAVYDAGADRGEFYIVMQLISGISLADLVSETGALPLGWAAAIGAQISSVLAAAHRVSLVHRDLKPGNVVISDAGEVTVLDFGIAAVLDPDVTRLTIGDEVVGSPAYMAPEQVLHGQVSPRTDLYALGCVLYEMLTGGQVFDGDTSYVLMHSHVDRDPVPLRSARPDVPEDVEALVLELLAKDPSGRPADASAVHERLLPYLPVPSPGGTALDRPVRNDPTRPFRHPLAPRPAGPARDRVRAGAAAATDAGVEPDERVDVREVQREAADLLDSGRFTQAADVLSRALDSVSRSRPQGSSAQELRLALANARLIGEDFAKALPLYERVLADLGGGDDELASYCRYQIAVCLAATGQNAAALEKFGELLQQHTARLGPGHPDTVEVRRQMIMLTASSGDVNAAISGLRRLIADVGSHGWDGGELEELSRLLTHLKRLAAG